LAKKFSAAELFKNFYSLAFNGFLRSGTFPSCDENFSVSLLLIEMSEIEGKLLYGRKIFIFYLTTMQSI
jgi:hypothetical protein